MNWKSGPLPQVADCRGLEKVPRGCYFHGLALENLLLCPVLYSIRVKAKTLADSHVPPTLYNCIRECWWWPLRGLLAGLLGSGLILLLKSKYSWRILSDNFLERALVLPVLLESDGQHGCPFWLLYVTAEECTKSVCLSVCICKSGCTMLTSLDCSHNLMGALEGYCHCEVLCKWKQFVLLLLLFALSCLERGHDWYPGHRVDNGEEWL